MKTTFLFERKNYAIMIAGIALIVLGLALMTGGGSEDPNVIVLGLSLEVWAIMHKPKVQ